MKYEYVRPTLDDAKYVADNIKSSNKAEIIAIISDHVLSDIIRSMKYSDDVGCLRINGKAAAIYGVHKASVMSDYGLVWLLMTRETEQHKVFIGKATKKGLQQILRKYSRVYNWCNVENTEILKWIKWLGGKVYDPKPRGVYGKLHCYFEFTRE